MNACVQLCVDSKFLLLSCLVLVCHCIHLPHQLPSLGSLTPHAAACLPRLCLSPSAVSWWDSVSRWLLTQPAEVASSLEPLLQRLLPLCLEFLGPVLSTKSSSDRGEVSTSAVQLHSQHLQLHPTHLVNSCCKILEVSKVTCTQLVQEYWPSVY